MAYIGYNDMLTLSNGNVYGKGLGSLVTPETERLSEKNNARGSEGRRVKADFICGSCGYRSTIAVNSARNIERIEKAGQNRL